MIGITKRMKFTGIASEHKQLPNSDQFCTYAWFDVIDDYTDEILHSFPIAVHVVKNKKREYVLSEPVWNFISEERTEDQQYFIDKYLGLINDKYIEFVNARGYNRL